MNVSLFGLPPTKPIDPRVKTMCSAGCGRFADDNTFVKDGIKRNGTQSFNHRGERYDARGNFCLQCMIDCDVRSLRNYERNLKEIFHEKESPGAHSHVSTCSSN